jgi:hypothetical protein
MPIRDQGPAIERLRANAFRIPTERPESDGTYEWSSTTLVVAEDATRCGGVSAFLDVGGLCRAAELPLSSHTAPALHLSLGCAVPPVRHSSTSTITCASREWLSTVSPRRAVGCVRRI